MASGRLKALKHLLRLASGATGLLLFVLSCAGFKHVQKSGTTLEGHTTFGCLCFLGVCFGLLLALSETQREFFFFFFGFLRYRVGRAVLFAVAGIMMALMGKSLTDQCDCSSYVLLIIEGVACMALAVLHALAIYALGNNTAPGSQKSAPAAATTTTTSDGFRFPGLPVTSKKASRAPPTADEAAAFTPVVQPAQPFADQPQATAPSTRRSDDGGGANLPAWMRP